MRYFIQKLIILLLLSGSFFDANSQTNEIVRSNEKVVVAGKFYYLHIVREKQTMFSICKAYGADIKEVMKINRKRNHSLDLNEILRIPFVQSQNVRQVTNKVKRKVLIISIMLFRKATLYILCQNSSIRVLRI